MSKSDLRKQLLAYRRLLPEQELAARNLSLAELSIAFLKPLIKHSLHVFLPITRNNEPNTFPIADYFLANGKKVIISKTDFSNHTMTHYAYGPELKIENNKFGIPEPISGKEEILHDLDVVLIPLLGVDDFGNRIGYGKGYYDELLAQLPETVLKVGLSLSDPLDHLDFAEEHDVALDMCITPFDIIDFRENNEIGS
jgi:5-formyltetrahydrofolate cyclo-ligase